MKIANISPYSNYSFPLRRFHTQIRESGLEPHTIFFKDVNYKFRVHAWHKPITDREMGLLMGVLKEVAPRVITLSVQAPYAETARKIVLRLREFTDAPVVAGGVLPTVSPHRALAFADYACRGEGEAVMDQIIARVKEGRDLRGIRGLWYRDDEGRVVDMEQQRCLANLDALPYLALDDPGMHFIEDNTLSTKDPEMDDPLVWIMTGRGCYFQCAYCINSVLLPMNKGNGTFVRQQSPERIVAELEHQIRRRRCRAQRIVFYDELFGVFGGWTRRFASLYKEKIGLPFYCEIHPKLIKEENIRLLADAGLSELTFGVQSGSETVRNRVMNRPGSNAEMLEKARIAARTGVVIWYDIILDNPFETVETLREAIGLLSALPRPFHARAFRLQYFPDHPITERALREGHITAEDLTDENVARPIFNNNFFYTPRAFSRQGVDHLRNAIFCCLRGSRLSPLVCRKLLKRESLLWGMLANLLAANLYYEILTKNSELLHFFKRTVQLIFRGDFAYLKKKVRDAFQRTVKY